MDREKMIEKIARIICENGTVDCFCPEPQRVACTSYNKARDILKELIPDGAVVLTREEQIRQAEKRSEAVGEIVRDAKEQARKETAREIWEKGRQLYNKYSDKDIAMNLLAAWIENNFGVEVE